MNIYTDCAVCGEMVVTGEPGLCSACSPMKTTTIQDYCREQLGMKLPTCPSCKSDLTIRSPTAVGNAYSCVSCGHLFWPDDNDDSKHGLTNSAR